MQPSAGRQVLGLNGTTHVPWMRPKPVGAVLHVAPGWVQTVAALAAVHAVRFSGYDGAMEAPFFVGEGALKRIQPDMPSDEAGLLNAFDLNRERIYAIASKVYERGRKGSYDLLPEDF